MIVKVKNKMIVKVKVNVKIIQNKVKLLKIIIKVKFNNNTIKVVNKIQNYVKRKAKYGHQLW